MRIYIYTHVYTCCLHFSICACHPCAVAVLIFSASLQFSRMIPEGKPPRKTFRTSMDLNLYWLELYLHNFVSNMLFVVFLSILLFTYIYIYIYIYTTTTTTTTTTNNNNVLLLLLMILTLLCL